MIDDSRVTLTDSTKEAMERIATAPATVDFRQLQMIGAIPPNDLIDLWGDMQIPWSVKARMIARWGADQAIAQAGLGQAHE